MSVTPAWNLRIDFEYPERQPDEDGLPGKDFSDELDDEIMKYVDEIFTGNAACSPYVDAYFGTESKAYTAYKRIQMAITKYGGRVL